MVAAPAPLPGRSPPTLPPELAPRAGDARQILAFLLSVCLALFLADAVVSLADDSLILFLGVRLLAVVRGAVFFLALLMAGVVYAAMGLTPMVLKRLFLPITLFNPVAALAVIPFAIYFYSRLQEMSWVISCCQVILGLGVLCWVQGGLKLRWPLVAVNQLGPWRFSWLNLSAFLLGNVFVALPAVLVFLVVCASLAVGHITEGFLTLRPGGFTVQVRTYVRNDGETIQLVPMAHIGEADFYRKLSHSFPTNSVVLMEGVTDNSNLITNTPSYQRVATSLGLATQEKEFNPVQVEMVMADVDVAQFTTNTIGFLNLAMLLHSKGLNAANVLKLLSFSPPPNFDEQLIDDLLRKRNQHLLEEIRARLPKPEPIIVPWGVAHMPGIAAGIQASGFHLAETREYTVIRFHFTRKKGAAGKAKG